MRVTYDQPQSGKKICTLSMRGAGSVVCAGMVTVTAVVLRRAGRCVLLQIGDHCLVGGIFQDRILNTEQPRSSPFDKGPQNPDDCQAGVQDDVECRFQPNRQQDAEQEHDRDDRHHLGSNRGRYVILTTYRPQVEFGLFSAPVCFTTNQDVHGILPYIALFRSLDINLTLH
jgi:hypothetical protein